MRTQFLDGLMRHMGVDPALVEAGRVVVAADPERANRKVTTGYEIDDRFVVACDPAVEELLIGATAEMSPTLDAWHEVAAAHGGEFLGAGRMQLHATHDLPPAGLGDGYALRTMERDVPADLAAITRLIDSSDEDDLDEAELELDNLDATITVVIDGAGEIMSYASARPFDMVEGYGDIGILTRPECRGKGLAKAAIAGLFPRLLDAGLEPLYRCGEENTGSVELSRSLGFAPATMLAAYRW